MQPGGFLTKDHIARNNLVRRRMRKTAQLRQRFSASHQRGMQTMRRRTNIPVDLQGSNKHMKKLFRQMQLVVTRVLAIRPQSSNICYQKWFLRATSDFFGPTTRLPKSCVDDSWLEIVGGEQM